jgi:hypothetical protein
MPIPAAVERERKLLQRTVAVLALIPIGAGLAGVIIGPTMVNPNMVDVSAASHYRYLSGLLLCIGLLFWSTIPDIEEKGPRFRLLTLIVVTGGLARLLGLMLTGVPSLAMLGGLAMELVVTPLLCLWQWRVARRTNEAVEEAERAEVRAGLPPLAQDNR